MDPTVFIDMLQSGIKAMANQAGAERMGAYMRNQFAFLGVHTPERRRFLASIDKFEFDTPALFQIVETLWEQPCREFQYVAIDLLARRHRSLRIDTVIPLLELAQRKPWWDTVDGLAGVVGDVIRLERSNDADPHRTMDQAIAHESMWVRRVAMTHQLGWRMETDSARLFSYANALASEQAFFIRKAIGWALRDYARWNPDAVYSFVTENTATLSALTVKEALKHQGR